MQHCANGCGFTFRRNTKKSNLLLLFSRKEEVSLMNKVFSIIISQSLGAKGTGFPENGGAGVRLPILF